MQAHQAIGAPVLKWHGGATAAVDGGSFDRLRASDKLGTNGADQAVEGTPSHRLGSDGDRTGLATFVLSTDDVDRHGDVVSADGWRLEAYLRNPVLLWAHDYRRPAIGRAASVWAEPHRLLAKVEFAPTAFAQEVAALYEYGFQWGVSVGFRPMRWEERRDSRTGAFLGLRYLEQELLEASAVPVPANRHALRRGSSPPPQRSGGGSIVQEAGAQWQAVALGALLAELGAGRV